MDYILPSQDVVFLRLAYSYRLVSEWHFCCGNYADIILCVQSFEKVMQSALLTIVTSLSQWPSTSVYNTVGMMHHIAGVCQWQRRLVNEMFFVHQHDNV